MEERKINFETNDDQTLVSDQNGKLYEKLKVMQNGINEKFSLMLFLLKEKRLTKRTKEASLDLFHRIAIELLNELGYENFLDKKFNKCTQEISSLKKENQELKKQLGMKVSNEDARERLGLIYEAFMSWWENKGTGNIGSMTFNSNGMTVTLSGYVSPCKRIRLEEEEAEILREKGFDVSFVKHYGNYLSATENNFNILKELFKIDFPHSDIEKINTITHHKYGSKGEYVYVISEIIVNFDNLDDIKITEP